MKYFNETTQNFFYLPIYKIDKEQEIKIFIETINFIFCGNLMNVDNSQKVHTFKTDLFKYKKYSNLRIVLLIQNY